MLYSFEGSKCYIFLRDVNTIFFRFIFLFLFVFHLMVLYCVNKAPISHGFIITKIKIRL